MTQRLYASLVWAVCGLCLGQGSAFAQGTKSPAPRPVVRPAQSTTTPAAKGVPRQTAPVAGNATLEDAESEPLPAARTRPVAKIGPRPAPLADDPDEVPQVEMLPVSSEMVALLREWEQKTSGFTSLDAKIHRKEIDHIFYTETRSEGKLWYANPDKGRIDFDPAGPKFLAAPVMNKQPNGKPYRIVNAEATRWISTGEHIFILEVKSKQYRQIEIPPSSRGKNITRSPLPFLFGMKADDAMARFQLTFGKYHDPDNKSKYKNGGIVNVVAYPKDPVVYREYKRAEVILSAKSFLPIQLKTLDPSDNKETIYDFSEVNLGATWILNPFKVPTFGGWTKLSETKAEPEAAPPPKRAAQAAPRLQ